VFTIQSWIHWESEKNEVKKRAKSTGHSDEAGTKTGMEIEEGALVELSLKPRLLTDPNGGQELLSKTVRWEGHPTNVEFILMWPESAPPVVYETITIAVEGIPLGECTLKMRLNQSPKENIVSDFKKIARAFVSYAHEDSQRVLASVQAFLTVTNVELFLDVDSLRAGENWEEKLRAEVPTRDALLLYWSENAAKSEWVEREWRLALKQRGLEYIKPMPLDPLLPPEELSELQFADKWSRLAEYQRLKSGG
jgi:hypothetical protein